MCVCVSCTQLGWECINPKKQSKKKYKNSGTVNLDFVKVKDNRLSCYTNTADFS